VALVLADGGQRLFVANQRSGSISAIDTTTRRLTSETNVGADWLTWLPHRTAASSSCR